MISGWSLPLKQQKKEEEERPPLPRPPRFRGAMALPGRGSLQGGGASSPPAPPQSALEDNGRRVNWRARENG